MSGSAMYFMGTLMPYSHARRDLSSEVEIKRLSSSQKVRVLMAARWWSYSWTTSPERTSYWRIFLLDRPARNSC